VRDDECAPPKAPPEDEIVDIRDSAKTPKLHIQIMRQGRHPGSFTLFEEARSYYKKMYGANEYQHKSMGCTKIKSRQEKTQPA
jgi:hypothetical protein